MIKNLICYFLIINFFFLFINLALNLNFKKINNSKILSNFKNVDLFFLYITKKSFKQIAFLLNSKFNINKSNNNKLKLFDNKIKEKKVININFVGSFNTHYGNKLINDVIELLTNSFIFNFTSDNPDYLVYDIFNCDQLDYKYKNSIKIAYYTESIIPDFNFADYSIGFHNLNYLDRYFRKTTLIWIFQRRYLNIKNRIFEKVRKKVYRSKIRKKFCAAVISNYRSSDRFRIKFINELNKYKKVDMGGKYKNNVGKIKNKISFLSHYKFSIAMENSEGQGYVSEKILDSFFAGTIPIYYGGYTVDEFISSLSFMKMPLKNLINISKFIKN